jgi:predicted glycoside hydrolase/deacetylase ChbG (UPF0249 family)
VDVSQRILVANADDFGLCQGVNRGIIAAHESGIVTSTSLMVRWPAAPEAADYARSHPSFGIGLHLDLGEWILRNGEWRPLYEVAPPNDPQALAAEVDRQLAEFRRLVGRDPTHLDSHQHVHRDGPLRPIAESLAGRLGVPLRHVTSGVRYCGAFYGQSEDGRPLLENISTESLVRYLEALAPGVTELACHPGLDVDGVETMYRSERLLEVQALCDPRVATAVTAFGIHLTDFARFRAVSWAGVT